MAALGAAWAWVNTWAGALLIMGGIALVVLHLRWFARDRILLTRVAAAVPPVPIRADTPKISVLVAAWNEEAVIEAHIASFAALRYPHKHLILCAGGADETYQRARRCATSMSDVPITVLEQQPGEGKQRALQRCLAHADGALIYLTDADCLFADAVLETLIAPLLDGSEQVVTGTMRPWDAQLSSPLVLYVWLREVYIGVARGAYTDGVLGANTALTRAALVKTGAFAAEVRIGTDFHLAKSLIQHGYSIRYVRESVIQTTYSERLGDYRRRQARWLKNLVVHGASFGARHEIRRGLMPTIIGIGMVIVLPVGALVSPLIAAAWALLFAHMIGRRVSYMTVGAQIANIRVPARVWLTLPIFTIIDLAVWASVAWQYVDRRRLMRW
jgi:cellulose synthase/poly-beta-1,6-N-acetylglucosamine synthase-like glycosyltransferase